MVPELPCITFFYSLKMGGYTVGTIRTHHTEDFTVMSNYHFKDTSLSLKAKGLLSMMLSFPDNWKYSVEGLTQLSSDGETAVRTALQELEEHNYLRRKRVHENGKLKGTEYHVFETPELCEKYFAGAENLHVENLIQENLIQENLIQENPGLLNTNNNKILKNNKRLKDKILKERNSTEKPKNLVSCKSGENTVQGIVDMYHEMCPTLSRVKAITPKRKKGVLDKLEAYGKDAIKEVFETINESAFLLGDNDRGWKVDFDFIFVRQDGFLNILEGKYSSSKKKRSKIAELPCNKNVKTVRSKDHEQKKKDYIRKLKEEGEQVEY